MSKDCSTTLFRKKWHQLTHTVHVLHYCIFVVQHCAALPCSALPCPCVPLHGGRCICHELRGAQSGGRFCRKGRGRGRRTPVEGVVGYKRITVTLVPERSAFTQHSTYQCVVNCTVRHIVYTRVMDLEA